MLRFLRHLVELIAAFVGVTVVLALLVIWRISTHPLNSDFLTPYVETGIETIVPNSRVNLGATLLTWSGTERSVQLHADHIKVTDASGFEIASIPSFDAKISLLGMIFGQFMPRELSIDHPQIKLDRDKDGAFVFGGMSMGGGEAKPAEKSTETMGQALRNLVQDLSHSPLMHRLAVTRAVFDVHDEITQKDWSIALPEISIERKGLSLNGVFGYGALEGRVTVEVTQKDNVASLDVQYAYDPFTQHHSLTTVFGDLTPSFIAGGHPESLGLGMAAIIDLPLSGKVVLGFDKTLSIASLNAQIHGGEGHLAYADFWDVPCPVSAFSMNVDFDKAAQKLTVTDTKIDLDGPTLALKIDGTASKQQGQDLDYVLGLTVENMPMNRYSELWPKPILPNPRYWLETNLRDGIFSHAEVSLKGSLAYNDIANLSVNDGGGKLVATNGRVTYLDGLPPAEGVNATATFDLKKMVVDIGGGGIGAIRMTPFTIQITGLADVDQYIDIPLQVAGPIPDILRLLDHPPLGYAKKLGIAPEDLQGKIEGTVRFQFPLLKTLEMKDVLINATANSTGVASTKLIPGVPIDQGNLALTLDTSGFALKGPVALGKAPFQVTSWQENFEEKPDQPLRHAVVVGTVKDDQWNNFGITLFNGTKGPINVSLDMTKPTKDKLLLSGSLDMTPAALNVDMVSWKKPAGVPATLKFATNSSPNKPVNVSSIILRGAQATATGTAVFSPDMSDLLSLNLSPLVLGRTNATVKFSQSFGDKGKLSLEATGASVDVSGLRGGKDPAKADPRPKEYNIHVEHLYTGDVGEITKAHGIASRDKDGWREINLQGLADGDTPLSVQLKPQPDGRRNFEIVCDSFGKAMKGLGFTDTIKGGKLTVKGQSSIEKPRVIVGTVKIGDFTVEKLPVLALLLNTLSPFGFTGILTDSADFSRFEGDYHWQGDSITLTRAHAAGSAVGINIDGVVDMNSGDANLQGNVVPFSVMNNILNYIPVLGGLITGGHDQGVLAIAYEINGTLSSPKISVNPVSLLTPGFIRNLFFRDEIPDDKKP